MLLAYQCSWSSFSGSIVTQAFVNMLMLYMPALANTCAYAVGAPGLVNSGI